MEGEVLLVNMPFGAANRPQIALGLLQAALRARGIPCDVAYLNLILAGQMGAHSYQWFSQELTDLAFAGDWVFAHPFFGEKLLDGDGYLQYLRTVLEADEPTIAFITRLRSQIPQYLDYCLRIIDWERYSIIGFTSTFEQNLASLSFAYAIKERYPDKIIVMGGSNFGYPMGEALMKRFPFIDYVFSGEADDSFPAFVERLARHDPISDVPGLVYRNGNETHSTDLSAVITEMDALPFPDYDDYFAQLEMSSMGKDLFLSLPFETARGCWWGAKHHCTFCGLNAMTMSFRSKSKKRALEEILYLASRYPVRQLAAVDNIIDMKYFRELLPELKQRKLDLKIFYETKSNLTREQVELLSDSGVRTIQPGIESFSFRLLKLLRKGVSPLQNIQLLKWCKQFEVHPIWNLLYGIPGECKEDYEEMLPLLQALTHLTPPASKGTIRLDRYSPYFQSPESYGLINAQPAGVYRFIYPFSSAELRDIVYYYEFAFADGFNPNHHIGPILRQLEAWDEAAKGGAELRAHSGAEHELVIHDSRPDAVRTCTKLAGWQRDVYDYCEQVRSLSALENLVAKSHATVPRHDLHDYLASLVEAKLMARDQDQFLSLAVSTTPAGLKADASPQA